MKTLILAATIALTATTSFADHYSNRHNDQFANPRFEQEADWVRNQYKYQEMHAQDYRATHHHVNLFEQNSDWVRNQYKYKRLHAQDYHRRSNRHHHHSHKQNSNSDASLMLGIILGAIVANSNQ